eukprot:scaffold1510_cov176-Ochromonas_danica.AAC.10
MSPVPGEKLHIIRTNSFILHHFESLSGLVFVLNTKLDIPGKLVLPTLPPLPLLLPLEGNDKDNSD